MRRGRASLTASPLLVGATTVLVVLVAVVLAYNANQGLPFVPTRELDVQLRDGSNLVAGNEVRSGGFRVGIVSDLRTASLAGGRGIAIARLKLDESAGPIPADSRVVVRQRSALGLKYVDLNRGRSPRELVDGATLPLAQTEVPVQFDEVLNMFDRPTRRAAQDALTGFGDAFAIRGADLNRTVEELPGLFGDLAPVARTLADPETRLGRFFNELADAARVVAPVADVNARLFSDMATTFAALAADPAALRDTIAKSPGTLAVGTESLRVQRPFLSDTASVSHDLRLTARELRPALPIINDALEIGTPVLRRTVALNRRLDGTLAALRDLARDPGTTTALSGLDATVGTLGPQLRFLGPFQTVCDDWNYWWTYLAEHISEPDPTGLAQRVGAMTAGEQDNAIGAHGATGPANAEGYVEESAPMGDPAVLHGRMNFAAVDRHGNADCEIGQSGYEQGPAATYAPKTSATGQPLRVVLDPHLAGNQGPTYQSLRNGITRVPRGQTFSAEPETGAQLPVEVRQP
jgi:virulence factor Mce-like protein